MHLLIAISTLAPIILIGCLLPIMARTRRGLLFGVTVPLDFATSPSGIAILRHYVLRTAILALTIILASVLTYAFFQSPMLPLLSFVAIPVELLGGLIFWQAGRRATRPHATTVPLVRTAELLPQRHLTAISASLAALLPQAAVALWLHTRWNQIPARWPQHWDASGQVNAWGTRTPASVYAPLLIGFFTVLAMTAITAFLALASGPHTPQRRRALAPLAALVWLISGSSCAIALLPLRPNISPAIAASAIAFYLLAIVAITIAIVRQSDSLNTGPTADPYDGTPDARWHGGLIYYNPTDAAVIVPKRYGFGWTLNFARPASWLCTAGLLLLITLFTIVGRWLK